MSDGTSPQEGSSKAKQKTPRQWHWAHEDILKEWGEAAACYRYMHYNAFKIFKQKNIHFSLPIIVISTVTGTANFAQTTFPSAWQQFVPSVIGAMNLFTAILTTVMQFLKINELMESHRVSYVSYAKLARNIRLELSLPISERSQHGSTMVDICGTEYGRLIEQSPILPGSVIRDFEKEFGVQVKPTGFSRPEFLGIKLINPFKGTKERNILDEAVNVLETKSLRERKTVQTKYQSAKDSVLEELRRLREPRTPRLEEAVTVVDIEHVVPSHSASLTKLSKLFEASHLEDEPR
jgi:hypothetical protein